MGSVVGLTTLIMMGNSQGYELPLILHYTSNRSASRACIASGVEVKTLKIEYATNSSHLSCKDFE